MTQKPKIIVLDDDPTGSQTVHSCLLLMQWDVETLRLGLQDSAPIFFILTNTRALPPEQADRVTREVCHNLKIALEAEKITEFLVVSRSDSTLRGHYPIETDAIAAELGPFDAHFLTPAFFEGGRITRDSIHYLIIDGVETPVHQTEFAKDSVFGYTHSYLPDYVQEKTNGRIASEQVVRFLLGDIRAGSQERLRHLQDNVCCAVDGEKQEDLDRFAEDVLTVAGEGKRFLFRSAASLLTSLAQLGPQPVPPEEMASYKKSKDPGLVLVGSHVQKTTQQLKPLLRKRSLISIEVNLDFLKRKIKTEAEIINTVVSVIYRSFNERLDVVVYTSREELQFETIEERLEFGMQVSNLLMKIVSSLPYSTGFLISKGGITSNDVLSKGLKLRSARLLGQILPGCSLVVTPEDHPKCPQLPVVLFPGNVGDEQGLVTVYQRLRQPRNLRPSQD